MVAWSICLPDDVWQRYWTSTWSIMASHLLPSYVFFFSDEHSLPEEPLLSSDQKKLKWISVSLKKRKRKATPTWVSPSSTTVIGSRCCHPASGWRRSMCWGKIEATYTHLPLSSSSRASSPISPKRPVWSLRWGRFRRMRINLCFGLGLKILEVHPERSSFITYKPIVRSLD